MNLSLSHRSLSFIALSLLLHFFSGHSCRDLACEDEKPIKHHFLFFFSLNHVTRFFFRSFLRK
ncbi:hypothetical protein Bca4012_066369 [Brassica carinata]